MIPGQRERIGQLLEEMEAEAGPIPPDLLLEASQLWQRTKPTGDPVPVEETEP